MHYLKFALIKCNEFSGSMKQFQKVVLLPRLETIVE
jgi:hypothetical protein